MRLIWNAGIALAMTAMLTSVASLGSERKPPLRAAAVSTVVLSQVASQQHRHRCNLPEHFQLANVTHDGKLTAIQASHAGWSRIVRHFGEIDTAHLGFVTQEQIHAYDMTHRRSHRNAESDV